MTPLSIKVCGMTEAENIREVEQLGVDMISKRSSAPWALSWL